MTLKLEWTHEARADRHAIYDYIEFDNPGAALTMDGLVSEKARSLLVHPMKGRFGRVAGTRELIVHRNYVLVYDVTPNAVRILRVLHVARQWPVKEA